MEVGNYNQIEWGSLFDLKRKLEKCRTRNGPLSVLLQSWEHAISELKMSYPGEK